MIRSVCDDSAFIEAVASFSTDDPFTCRLISLCRSYPPTLRFVGYWLITDEAGKTNGAIARNGSSFLLYLTDHSDCAEVSDFLHMAGAAEVLCDGKYTLENFAHVSEGILMKTTRPVPADREDRSFFAPDLRAVHALLLQCTDDDFSPPAFEDFYVDVNHKQRHGTVRLCGVNSGDQLAAAAMTVAECDGCAVLGAVACRPDFRRQGFGTAVVSQLTNQLIAEGKTVFLHRANGKNAAFYSHLGFTSCGTWREYRVTNQTNR